MRHGLMPNWRAPKHPTDLAKLLGNITSMSNELAKPDMAEVIAERAAAATLVYYQTRSLCDRGARIASVQVFRNLDRQCPLLHGSRYKNSGAFAPGWQCD